MLSFSRSNRLLSKHDFQSVFAKANKITRKYLLALYSGNGLPHARLGIIIGKHHIKHSVNRNQIRRVLRESFRHHKETIKGLDLVVIMRSRSSPVDKKILRNDIDYIWQAIASLLNPVP